MISRILRDYTHNAMTVDESSQPLLIDRYANRSTFIELIEDELGLIDTFFRNFEHYMFKARIGLRQKQAAEPQTDVKLFAEKILADRFCHSD